MFKSCYLAAIAAIDQANAEDPNTDTDAGATLAKELLYSQRMCEMQERYIPDSSEALKLAVRAQHIQRWKIPRSSFPMDKPGYLQWRTQLYKFHAQTVAEIMRGVGYDQEMISRVMTIVSKKGLKVNAETQALEDVAGLVFIEHYLADFASQHPDYDTEKWLRIIRRTWLKMSASAHEFALAGKIKLPAALLPLILKAVQT